MSDRPTTACDELTCEEVEELLPLVADGVLDVEDDPALFAHVARCPDCQQALATHDLINLALGQDQTPAPTPTAADGKIIRFRLPLAAAALWFLAIGGGILGIGTLLQDDAPPVTDTDTPRVMVLEEGPSKRNGQQQFILRVGDDIVETPAQDTLDPRGQDASTDTANQPPEFVPVSRKRH